MILLIDSYDSFTYNLCAELQVLLPGESVSVVRNDTTTVEDLLQASPRAIVLSPGPGRPEEAGVLIPLVQRALGRVPLLGICLGHQAIQCALGGSLRRLREPVHGKVHEVRHDGRREFADMSCPIRATRYHSLAFEPDSIPDALVVSARAADGTVMAVRHRHALCHGWQFHPESVTSVSGRTLLANFLRLVDKEGTT